MKKKSYILVVGGAGFIGSHTNKMLHTKGYQTVVLDNLSQGSEENVTRGVFVKGSTEDKELLQMIFTSYPISAVMHFAALTDVGESVTQPAKYYTENVVYTLNLLEAMRQHMVKFFVFSSSAAIFGIPVQKKMDESHPCNPINPYGKTKLIVEMILQDFDKAYGLKSSCLRYYNAIGADPTGEIKNRKTKDLNLVPLILRSLSDPKRSITIFGTDYDNPDGTCLRDYIHVEDLATAHILAMEALIKNNHSSQYNLGNENGISVRDIIASVERVTKAKVNAIEGPRRPGDPSILVANSHKIQRELGWRAKYRSLDEMIAHAWQALIR